MYCKDPIKRLACHEVKWIDGAFELKFTRVIYEGDMALDGKTVTDVRVREGRLPE